VTVARTHHTIVQYCSVLALTATQVSRLCARQCDAKRLRYCTGIIGQTANL